MSDITSMLMSVSNSPGVAPLREPPENRALRQQIAQQEPPSRASET